MVPKGPEPLMQKELDVNRVGRKKKKLFDATFAGGWSALFRLSDDRDLNKIPRIDSILR